MEHDNDRDKPILEKAPEMEKAESEVSYVTARETAEQDKPRTPTATTTPKTTITVPVVLEPVIQVTEEGKGNEANAMPATTVVTPAMPITPSKSVPHTSTTGLSHNASRTRSGSGTRWSPSGGQDKGVARRGSLAEGGASLQKWWNSLTNAGGEDRAVAEVGEGEEGLKRESSRTRAESTSAGPGNNVVFGERLEMSLIYAAVPITTARHDAAGGAEGESYVWGYVPVVVAKCGSHLKETATGVEGTFRVSGSAKRMKDLQAIFDSPPKYGKDLDWSQTQYTTHDVATILRRYLTQMPEPIIPHELYYEFRNVMTDNSMTEDEKIAAYKDLILRMPKPNQYLLLYVLDMLSVFARRSDVNLMTAGNLATIFQPGIIAHPDHEMLPSEHAASQKVLEFLINKQDHFLIGMELEPVRSRSTGMGSASPVSPTSSKQQATHGASSLAPRMVSEPSSASLGRRRGSSIHKSSLDRKSPVAPPPRPPSPQRADSSIMPASDSDDEPPEGGWYVKTGDPTSLLRSRTAAANAALASKGTRQTAGGGGLMSHLSSRRASKTGTAIGLNEHGTATPPQVTVIENPDIAAIPARGLFRRRTAPTRRNKEDEAELRKRAERAVRDLGKMSAEAP
ncbi:hypothetical protein NliqN6_1550 [Naganishia liquefaciens]|uniref:Rho-GAP domain-containing protein n=1 Tax=Naganishia liquefaciens TaxID=104408 RepID=A0A8H3YDE9_9TREE|nr:hypothetical protein NliqN6_1550 [Naganishia liquefaciens]